MEFAYQENEGGIAEALKLADDFSDNESVCVILGDNCTDANIEKDVKKFEGGAHVFLKKVPDPHRFGVPSFNKKKIITKITEKPRKPTSDYAVTGLYIYDQTVFKKIRNLKPSKRGELEITDVNNSYIMDGNLNYSLLKGYWRDTGTFNTLFEGNKYWVKKARKK